MKYLLIFTTFLFAGELEVDGDLKVTGTVDAQGNPITNVGAALSMTDAINGNVLQDALRDDGPFEYKLVATKVDYNWLTNDNNGFQVSYKFIGSPYWNGEFESYLTQLSNQGWELYNISPYQYEVSGYSSFYWNQYI